MRVLRARGGVSSSLSGLNHRGWTHDSLRHCWLRPSCPPCPPYLQTKKCISPPSPVISGGESAAREKKGTLARIDLRCYLDRVDWVDTRTNVTYPTSAPIAFAPISAGRANRVRVASALLRSPPGMQLACSDVLSSSYRCSPHRTSRSSPRS